MKPAIIFFIVVACLLLISLLLYLVNTGITLCKRNNAIGIILLFISLNIFGLVIGWSILYNSRNGMYLKEIERLDILKKQKAKDKKVLENWEIPLEKDKENAN